MTTKMHTLGPFLDVYFPLLFLCCSLRPLVSHLFCVLICGCYIYYTLSRLHWLLCVWYEHHVIQRSPFPLVLLVCHCHCHCHWSLLAFCVYHWCWEDHPFLGMRCYIYVFRVFFSLHTHTCTPSVVTTERSLFVSCLDIFCMFHQTPLPLLSPLPEHISLHSRFP
jgi:hypothetical protein